MERQAKLKKIPGCFQILAAYRKTKCDGVLKLQPLANLRDGTVPPPCFVPASEGVYLPKKNRGDKFMVHFTRHEQIEF